jgi:phage baseplate assembly protein W
VPLKNTSRGFKDISLSFRRHPVTSDLVALKNVDAIKRSVQNLVRIQVGEVFFNSNIGTRITGTLFELMNDVYISPIKTEIETVIENYEPRVILRGVDVEALYDENALNIDIRYDVVGLAVPTQEINFILEPTRL